VPFFRATRDGRHVVALNVYPGLHQRALTFLDCADNVKSVHEAIARRDADEPWPPRAGRPDGREGHHRPPGLIHAQVLLHGAEGPWATRPGFDEIGACVSGIFALGGTREDPRMPPMLPIVDNIVGWFGTVGIMEAFSRRAAEGGSYRVRVSLTRVCLWLISLGIFDKEFATTTAGSTAEHSVIPPELFTAKTPLGTYQGMTDQIEFSSLPQGFTTTVLQPTGADQPEWLPRVAHPA
jgi:hypothetical protein